MLKYKYNEQPLNSGIAPLKFKTCLIVAVAFNQGAEYGIFNVIRYFRKHEVLILSDSCYMNYKLFGRFKLVTLCSLKQHHAHQYVVVCTHHYSYICQEQSISHCKTFS